MEVGGSFFICEKYSFIIYQIPILSIEITMEVFLWHGHRINRMQLIRAAKIYW